MVSRFKLLPIIALVLAGCNPPEAVFVSSRETETLMPAARQAVSQALEESFGTPQRLVAWLKMPVDYGQYKGAVQQAEGNTALRFKVNLTPEGTGAGAAGAIPNLKGAGFIWTSGSLVGLPYEEDGKTKYFSFTVRDYDAETQELSIESHPPSNDFASQTLGAGAEFVIAGKVLQDGRKLYMTHCMHCHGVSGDGAGPTAEYLNPLPRDYRRGEFKFTSTLPTDKVRRDDLSRTIRLGIPGTYMPSFMLLEDDELYALVEYVRWLSMRGEMERQMFNEFNGGGYSSDAVRQRVEQGEVRNKIAEELTTYIAQDFPTAVESAAEIVASNWINAEKESSVVMPKVARTHTDAASLERGRQLYLSDRAKCATCHGPTGRGNGPETETLKNLPGSTTEFYPEPGLFDSWGQKIQPRDLTKGIYRGGRRPLDIYRRVYSGIKGTPMPAFGGTVLKDEEIWDLVNYVMSIPYSADSPARMKSQSVAATDGK